MFTLEALIKWLGSSDHSGRRCGRDQGDLSRDQSGAIMIAGTFMAALLAAGVFFIISTGDAIVYRERLQDAADAAAFTSAGVHARGMNLIVVINLIMAALLAVLILMRLVIVILGIAIVACGICLAATIFCPIVWLCAPAYEPMITVEKNLVKAADNYEDNFLSWALPALSKLEVVIALTTPYVGAYKGNQVAKYYKPLESSGMAVSPSMVPFVPSSKKLGLPVQEMEYDEFCKKAGELITTKAFEKIVPLPIIADALGMFAGALVKAFSGFFCGNSEGGQFEQIMNDKINDQVTEGCKNQKDSCSQLKDGQTHPTCTGDYDQDKGTNCVSKYCTDMGSLGVEFNGAKCKDDGKKAAQDSKNQSQYNPKGGGLEQGSGSVLDFKNKTPKDIWEGAAIGSIWFQTFGVVTGDEQWPRRNDKGIAIATKSGQMPKIEAGWGNWRIAQAEFYFDDPGEWDKLKGDCMWKMHWRARLRRFNISGINLSQWGLGKLFDVIKKYSDGWLANVINGGGSVTGGALKQAGYDWLSDKLKGIVSGWGSGVDKAVDSWVQPSWEIIH
jgi:hypothetical protein